jgi:hypothetical protein
MPATERKINTTINIEDELKLKQGFLKFVEDTRDFDELMRRYKKIESGEEQLISEDEFWESVEK